MSDLDPYAPCVCESGKKLKFCCCKDILSDLSKVLRMIEGDQPHAALDLTDKLIAKHPDRAGLLLLSTELAHDLGDLPDFDRRSKLFLEKFPQHPTALAYRALAVMSNDVKQGVQLTQASIALVLRKLEQQRDEKAEINRALVDAFVALGQIFSILGNPIAALAHWRQLEAWEGGGGMATNAIRQLESQGDVTALESVTWLDSSPPENVTWEKEFSEAMRFARRGAWGGGLGALLALNQKHPQQRVILFNIAMLYAYLGEAEESRNAWRNYAALPGLSFEDAVYAETMAQQSDPAADGPQVDQLQLTYAVNDSAKLMERMLSDKRLLPEDPHHYREDESSPAPRGAFRLLDRVRGEDSPEQDIADVASWQAILLLFGKETDRDARLVVGTPRTEEFPEVQKVVAEIGGEFLGAVQKEEVVNQIPLLQLRRLPRWAMSPMSPPATRQKLIAEYLEKTFVPAFLNTPVAVLGGKLPREAGGNPQYQRALAARLHRLEIELDRDCPNLDLSALRSELQIPADTQPLQGPGPFTILRLNHAPLNELDVNSLGMWLMRTFTSRAHRASRRLANEVLRRGEETKVQHGFAHMALATLAPRFEDGAIGLFEKAREAMVEEGASGVEALFGLVHFHAARLEAETMVNVLKQIQARHIKEPGVRERLAQLVQALGLGGPPRQAFPHGHPQHVHGPDCDHEHHHDAAPAAAPGASKLWTPGGETSAKPAGGSGLWVPGAD